MAIWTLEDAEKQSGITIQSIPSQTKKIWDLESAESFFDYEQKTKQIIKKEPTKKIQEKPSIFKKIGNFFVSLVPKEAKEEIKKVREGLTKGIEKIDARDILPGLSFFFPKPVYTPESELEPYLMKGKEKKLLIKKEEKQTIEKLQKDYQNSLIGKFDDRFQYAKNRFFTSLTGGVLKPELKADPNLVDKIVGAIADVGGTAIAIRKIGLAFEGVAASQKALLTFFNTYPKLKKYAYPLLRNVVSFSVYGQLDPDLKDRLNQLKKDVLTSVPFTALGFVKKARYSIPSSALLGFFMAKFHGATNEDAFISGMVLGVLDAWVRGKKKYQEYLTKEKTRKIVYEEAVKVINRYSDIKIKVGDPIEKIAQAYRSASKKVHPDIIKNQAPQRAVNAAYEFLVGKAEKLNLDILKEGKYTSQDIINEVVKSGLEKTEEGKAIIKAALEAENKGADILITKTKPETKKSQIPDVIIKEITERTANKLKENVIGLDNIESAKKLIEKEFKGSVNDQIGFLTADKIIDKKMYDEFTVQEIIKKIQEGKKIEPVLLAKENNNFVVLAGGNTYEALKRLGKEIPVIYQGKDQIDGLIKVEDLYKRIAPSPSTTEKKPEIEAKPEEKIKVEESRGEVKKEERKKISEKEITKEAKEEEKTKIPEDKIETIKEKIKLFRGAKDHTIDVSRSNGITGGVSFSLSREVAQRFADKVEGTVKEYQLKEGAKIVNHSVLEEMVRDVPMELKEKTVKKIIKDNNIDAIVFDVPEGVKGEAEIRIVNEKVIEEVVKKEVVKEEKKEIKNENLLKQIEKNFIAEGLKNIKLIPIYKAYKNLTKYERYYVIKDNPNAFSDGYLLLLDRSEDEVLKWNDYILIESDEQAIKKELSMKEIMDMNILPKSLDENIKPVHFVTSLTSEDVHFRPFPLSLIKIKSGQYALVNSFSLKWLNKEGYEINAKQNIEGAIYLEPLVLIRNNQIAGAIMPVKTDDEELKKILDKYGTLSKIELYESGKISRPSDRKEKISGAVGVDSSQSGESQKIGGEISESGETDKPEKDLEYPRISRERPTTRLTPKEQKELNEKIKELVKKKGNKKENYTPEEISLLRKFTGSGGLNVNERGVLDEYYTPKPVVDFIWLRIQKLLNRKLSDVEGKFLEPAVGIGRFLEKVPQEKFVAYEINKIAADITKVLYPQSTVINEPFESIFIDERGNKKQFTPEYSIIVGNPPYGEHRGFFKGVGEEPKINKYEDYFLKRGIDLLKNNGVLVYVMPSGFMRRSINYAKEQISKQATLIEAYRLPNNIFETTSIGTDILIFQKGKPMNPLLLADDNFFNKRPENILGEITDKKDKFGNPIIEGDLNFLTEKFEEILNKGFLKLPEIETKPDEDLPPAVLSQEKPVGTGERVKGGQDIRVPTIVKNNYVIISKKKDRIINLSNVTDKEKEKWSAILPDGSFDINYIKSKFNIDSLKDFYSEDYGVYIENEINKFYPKELYFSGNIYEKLDNLEKNKHLFNEKQYEYQKRKLEEILPKPKKINEIYLKPTDKTLVSKIEFPVEGGISDKTETLLEKFARWLIEIPSEMFEDSNYREVIDYLESAPIKDALNKEHAVIIRKRRRRVGDKLFNKFLREVLEPKNQKIIEEKFNRTFNNFVRPDYTKIPLISKINSTFKGKEIELRDVQREGSSFLALKGVGLLAYDVGLGKTLTSIIALNEIMERGWVKRPLIIVQNSTYNQWLKELLEVIPNVKINSLTNLGGKLKTEINNIQIEDGTITLVTYDGFQRIGFRKETYEKFINELTDVISNLKVFVNKDKEDGGIIKKEGDVYGLSEPTEREKQKEKEKAGEMVGRASKGTSGKKFFEDFGFDHLIVDEIHNFKNIFTGAKVQKGEVNDYRNVHGTSSLRGVKLYFATQYILEKNNGRGVFGLSATPFTNNPLEIYSIISLFGKKRLEEFGLKNVNHFMSMFMNLQTKIVIKANQEAKEEDVIESFKNLEQLQKLVTQFIDFKTGDEIGIERPNKVKKPVYLSPNQYQIEAIRLTEPLFIPDREGKTGPMVAISELQNITLSPYFSRFNYLLNLPPLNYKNFVNLSPKIKYTLEIVANNYYTHKKLNQVIYMSRGVEFYKFMKEYLVKEKKIPADEIKEIIGGMDLDKRTEIQTAFNSGKIRILLGSSAIKEGIDLQERATDLFYLHLPWNPTDILQVEGRIWRYGNIWENVRIHYPLIENSVDSFIFQKLETKEKRIKNIWSYKGQEIEVGDLDFENMKLDLITDPVIREKINYTFEEKKLTTEINTRNSDLGFYNYLKNIFSITEKKINDAKKQRDDAIKSDSPEEVKYWSKRIKKEEANLEKIKNYFKKLNISLSEVDAKIKFLEKEIEKLEKQKTILKQQHFVRLEKAEKERVKIVAKENNYESFVNEIIEENKHFLRLSKKPVFEFAKPLSKESIEKARGVGETKGFYGNIGKISMIQEADSNFYEIRDYESKGYSSSLAVRDFYRSPLKMKFKKQGFFKFPFSEIRSPADIAFAFQELKNNAVESFYIIGVKNKVPKVIELISIGTVNSALVDPKDVTTILSKFDLDGIYMVHNHPSGEVEPSEDDVSMQIRIEYGLKELGIKLKGQVIINTYEFGFVDENKNSYVYPLRVEVSKETKVPVYQKYIEWLENKPTDPKISEPQDVVNLTKGLTLNWEKNSLLIIMNVRNTVMGVEVLPKNKINNITDIINAINKFRGSRILIVEEGKEILPEDKDKYSDRFSYLLKALNIDFVDVIKVNFKNRTFISFLKNNVINTLSKTDESGGFKEKEEKYEIEGKENIEIKAVEFPEILRIARLLLKGKFPVVKNLRKGIFGSRLGQFKAKGTGEIFLDPQVFQEEKLAAKVLAHELGHLADYLPDFVISRGNLVGRIATLNRHLKKLYGNLDNKVIREELKELSKIWKPFDDSNPKSSYVQYRYSSKELYADAISILFNDPALLKEKAPNFWKGFFDYLDRKPEVKENFFKIWDLLNKGEDEVYKERDKEVSEMFSKAEEKYTALHLERELRRKDLLYNIKLLFDDINTPIIKKIKELEKKGIKIPPKLNPDYVLKGLLYSDAEVKNFVEDNFGNIFREANKIENGWEKLGKILFYERVINERGDLANPLGYQPDTAQFNLDKLQTQETPENWEKLQSLKEKFREGIQKIIDLAEKEGYYSSEMIAQMKANPSYATFQVIDYLDTYISSKVYHQIGTLKEVANPATATVMKAISTYKAIKKNKAKRINIEFLKEYFKDEIQDAQLKWNGKTMEIKPPKDEFEGLVIVMEDGKPKGYYVDKDIADMLNYQNEKTLELLAELSRKISASFFYRPLFTTYNAGFQTFNFVRDLSRAWKNYPQKSFADIPLSPIIDFVKVLKNYKKAVKPTLKSVFGIRDDLIKEMENANILGLSYFDIFSGKVEPEMKQIERIMEGYGLFSRPKKFKLLKPIITLLDYVGKFGDVIERLPKVAAYIDLKPKFSEEETPLLAEIIRTQIGSPAFRVKGKATPITNSIFLFSNAIKEGLKVDFQVATGKRGKATASAFWYKTMLLNFLPKVILAAMVGGLLGDKIKRMVDNISEYDKTNYIVIPFGMDEKGKTVYVRIPQDETGRFLSGIFWKTININKDYGFVKSLMDIMAFGAGQFPNLSPAFIGWGALLSYLSGNNPYDFYRNRNIIPDQEFKAGWKRSLPIFMDWFIKNQGLGIMFPSYNPKNPTALEKVLSAPIISNILGRWIKVSDKGIREKLELVSQKETQKKAERYLQIKETINDMAKEYKENPSVLKRYELEKRLIKKFYEKGMDESEKTRLKKRLRVAIERGKDDPYINALINASSNNEKAAILVEIEKELDRAQFIELVKTARKVGIISSDAVRLYRLKKSEK